MPKPRSKRSDIRGERKKRKAEVYADNHARKRSKHNDDGDDGEANGQGEDVQENGDEELQLPRQYPDGQAPEKEFFGMLDDEEQEYFRRSDEMLELNQFPSPEDRELFIESVFKEAEGKELKLASSQSCSRLMERLIQLSSTSQKKKLFEAFGSHFLSLVQHRFASHCCEALFLRSAGVVSQELAGFVVDTQGAATDEQQPEASMESLFLATLDELEGSLSFLITDRFASHAVRVLLLVLSGRPLDDSAMRSLLKSKRKEKISVAGSAAADEANQGLRAVPGSFTAAVKKIVQDCTAELNSTSLRVLARHPIGNPSLQLLLELDLSMNKSDKGGESESPSLLEQLLPGAPQSLGEESSEASEFINGMIYDQIGSRLIETLITYSPGRVFKALKQHIFLPRIAGYVRNDVSAYAAIRVLNRLGKDDLVEAVEKIAPSLPDLVSKSRFNVLKALFERCAARDVQNEIKVLMKGLRQGCGAAPADLVLTLCCLKDEEKKSKDVDQVSKNQYAIQSHGAQLLTTLLSIPGPSKGVQESLLALSQPILIRIATTSLPTVTILTTALSKPSHNPAFHKSLVGSITPQAGELATSQNGHNLINAIAEVPSKGKERSVPFHMKEALMGQLAAVEGEIRESFWGRSVWRTWKGDMWKTRRGDWKIWMREVDNTAGPSATMKGHEKGNSKGARERHNDRPRKETHV